MKNISNNIIFNNPILKVIMTAIILCHFVHTPLKATFEKWMSCMIGNIPCARDIEARDYCDSDFDSGDFLCCCCENIGLALCLPCTCAVTIICAPCICWNDDFCKDWPPGGSSPEKRKANRKFRKESGQMVARMNRDEEKKRSEAESLLGENIAKHNAKNKNNESNNFSLNKYKGSRHNDDADEQERFKRGWREKRPDVYL